ncbi:MAG: LamG-like jellyroll fold domain-containing protein [Microscillaceae bacterium]|nr:LamG-like jellyroll fold domain-containing protein [Microscillaceae bacterium]
MRKFILFHVFILFICHLSKAQTGPGGIGNTSGSSDLRVWLKADAGLSFNNGDSVEIWQDQSGYGHHADSITNGEFPLYIPNTFNGFPVINFNGTLDQRLAIPDVATLDHSGDYTIFTVLNPIDFSANELFVLSKITNTAQIHYNIGIDNTDKFFSIYGNTAGFQRTSSNTTLTTNGSGYYLLDSEVDFTGTNSNYTLRINGVQDNTGTVAGQTANSSWDLTIGGGQLGAGIRRYGGNIAEIIIYNRTLNLVERTLIENYLEAKYGGTGTANLFDIPNDKYAQPADSSYVLGVVGIGQDNALRNTQAFSAGLRIRNRDFLLDNGDYLMFGYDASVNEVVTIDLPENTTDRWQRDWFIDIRDVGTANGRIDMIFDFSEAGFLTSPSKEYVLLFRSSPSGNYEILDASAAVSGDQVTFVIDVADLNPTGYYTLGKYKRKAGSGKGYTLDGSNSINSNYTTALPDKYSFSIWFELDNLSTIQAILGKGNSDADEELALIINPNGSILFDTEDISQTSIPGVIQAGRWYHLFGSKNSGDLTCWVNGVLISWQSSAFETVTDKTQAVTLGTCRNNTLNFSGQIDEAVLWTGVITDIDIIRSWMCKSIDGNHPNVNSILFYYRFDELVNSEILDFSRNNFKPALINNPGFGQSGAALGDESVYNYTSLDTTLSGRFGELIRVNNLSGTPDGFHIYRVDQSPDSLNTDLSQLDSLQFWGVFVAGGANPTYDFSYNFVGNPQAGDENQNRLAQRDDNSIPNWSNTLSVPNKQTNTLVLNDNLRGEYILGFDEASGTGKGPGSYQSIQYDGSDDYLDYGTTVNMGTSDFSWEVWFRVDDFSNQSTQRVISKGIGTLATPVNTGFALLIQDGAGNTFNAVFQIQDAGNPLVEVIETGLLEGEWYHLCGRRSGAEISLYVNGILAGTANTGVVYNVDNNASLALGAFIEPGSATNFFKGKIDEFRLWNTAVDPVNLQNWLCKKLNPSHPQYADLISYHRFDQVSGLNSPDRAGIYNALLSTEAGVEPLWGFSGAPLGDSVVVNFSSPSNLQMSSERSDFSLSAITGAPQGVLIYRVDEEAQGSVVPNDIFFLDPEYYGVFASSPMTYTATLDYSKNPYFIIESELRLLHRDNGESLAWTDDEGQPNYSQDVNTNIFTITGLTGTEFVLSGEDGALPISLIRFDARPYDDRSVILEWSTAAEVNNQYFELERSTDGLRFDPIGRIDGAGNSNQVLDYEFIDREPLPGLNYYRLRQVDIDGRFSFSNIRVILWENTPTQGLLLYPNPSTEKVILELAHALPKTTNLFVYDQRGQLILKQTLEEGQSRYQLDIQQLSAGVYLLEFFDGNRVLKIKLIKI